MADTLADLGKSAGERYGAPPRERWAPDHSDAAFVARKREQGAGWNSIAAMLGKPVADVRARFDKGFDKSFAYGRNRPIAALATAPIKPKQRGLTRDGKPRGEITVTILELVRDGVTTAKAIGDLRGNSTDRTSSQLVYCVTNGWATSTPGGANRSIYAVTPLGLAKIKAYREECS